VKLLPRVALVVFVLFAGHPLKSNIFGHIANDLKQRNEAVANGIGRAVGVKLSGVLETATAPALDDAASKFTGVLKGTADRLDQSLQAENETIDTIARRNVDHIDTLVQTRLDQVDKLIGDRLQRVETDANGLLNREASIIDNALKQENTIATNALDRVATISDQSLNRLQGLESDAFDRIDSAFQDEVPVAASQVAHEFVIGALVVACVVALFGFAGISLWKNFQAARNDDALMGKVLESGFASFWRTLPQQAALVIIPTVLIALAILGGYEGYLRSTQAMRVSRLENAAGLLETTGEYTLASQLRRRVLAVDGANDSNRKAFSYQADLWLSDFIQKRSVDTSDLIKRIALLENNSLSAAHADLRAAALYLNASMSGSVDSAAIKTYRETFLDGKTPSQAPFLGKLVLMTEIKSQLDREAPAGERVESALKIVQDLRTFYPNYANGHVLAAALLGMQADALASGQDRDANKEPALRKQVTDELERASLLDPALMRIVRLNNAELPADLSKDLDQNPRSPGLAARLGTFAGTDIDPVARAVLVSDVLTHLAVDRTVLHASRLAVGERRVARAILSLPASGSNPQQRASAMLSIAQQFLDIDGFLPAENWAQSARKVLTGAESANTVLSRRIDSISQAVAQSKISDSLAAVI
jgi:hypothetical protein